MKSFLIILCIHFSFLSRSSSSESCALIHRLLALSMYFLPAFAYHRTFFSFLSLFSSSFNVNCLSSSPPLSLLVPLSFLSSCSQVSTHLIVGSIQSYYNVLSYPLFSIILGCSLAHLSISNEGWTWCASQGGCRT